MGNRKGFLLLEVVLTIVIIATGLIFVTRVYSTAGQIIHRSAILFKSGLLLEDKIFEYEEKGSIKKDFTDHGEFKDEKGYSWAIKSESPSKESFSAEEAAINVVTLDVACADSKNSLVTYLRNKR